MYAELVEFMWSVFIIIGAFLLLINLERILFFLRFFVEISANLVQELLDYATIRMNGGHDYGKKQGNFKRTRSGSNRRR